MTKRRKSETTRAGKRTWLALALQMLTVLFGNTAGAVTSEAAVGAATAIAMGAGAASFGRDVEDNGERNAERLRGVDVPSVSVEVGLPPTQGDDDDTAESSERKECQRQLAAQGASDDAIPKLCGNIEQCELEFDDCMKHRLCIVDYLAKHPHSRYLEGATRDGDAECRPGGKPKLPPPDIRACHAGDSRATDPNGDARYANMQAECEKYRQVGVSEEDENDSSEDEDERKQREKTARRDISHDVGMAATRGWAEGNLDGFTCAEGSGGQGDFDMVCFQMGPDGEVQDLVIIEAKGGGSQLGDRWEAGSNASIPVPDGTTRRRRVQQGTPEYMDSIIHVLLGSSATFDVVGGQSMSGDQLAKLIASARDSRNLRYVKINGTCGKGGGEGDAVHVESFVVDREERKRRCSPTDSKCPCAPGQ